MKRILISLMFVIISSQFTFGQGDLYSFPYPRTVDSVFFILTTNWGTVTELDSFNYQVYGTNNDTVLVNCYYADWSWAQPTQCIDTLNFSNLLDPKSYYFKFKIFYQIANIGNPTCVDTFYYSRIMIYNNTKIDIINNKVGVCNIYPNPSHNSVNISYKLEKKQDINFEIYNEAGISVYNKNINKTKSENIEVDVSNFNKGIYFVKLRTKNNHITKKFIIE